MKATPVALRQRKLSRAEVVYVRCECDEDMNPKAIPCD